MSSRLTLFMDGVQSGQRSMSLTSAQTRSGEAAISIVRLKSVTGPDDGRYALRRVRDLMDVSRSHPSFCNVRDWISAHSDPASRPSIAT